MERHVHACTKTLIRKSRKWCWGTVTTRPHAKKRLVHARVTHYYKKSKRPYGFFTGGGNERQKARGLLPRVDRPAGTKRFGTGGAATSCAYLSARRHGASGCRIYGSGKRQGERGASGTPAGYRRRQTAQGHADHRQAGPPGPERVFHCRPDGKRGGFRGRRHAP